MRILSFVAVVGLVSLSACAHGRGDAQARSSDDEADARVNQWIGRDIVEVVRAWGPPTTTQREGSGKVFVWRWGKPERFSSQRKDSRSEWVDRTARWTPAGSIVAKSTGWMAECRESFDVDARARVTAAHSDGRCPPGESMILEGSESGTEGYGVGEL
jgi:hypothetical protein